jgi:hypothetical protein
LLALLKDPPYWPAQRGVVTKLELYSTQVCRLEEGQINTCKGGSNNWGSIAAAQKANRRANKTLLDQATSDTDSSDSHGDDGEPVDRQHLDMELGPSGPLLPQINLPRPIASELVAVGPVASEPIRPARRRKRTQAVIEAEDELLIRASRRKRQKRTL